MFYEMITGHRAFRGETPMLTLAAVIKSEPLPMEGLHEEFSRIIRRCPVAQGFVETYKEPRR